MRTLIGALVALFLVAALAACTQRYNAPSAPSDTDRTGGQQGNDAGNQSDGGFSTISYRPRR
jgi:predicted small lipoprotein YifL